MWWIVILVIVVVLVVGTVLAMLSDMRRYLRMRSM